MIKTSTLQLAMGQLAEARETLAVLASLKHMGIGASLVVRIPSRVVAEQMDGQAVHAPEGDLFLSVEVVREALRTRLRTLAEALGKAGLTFDEAGEELGKPPRARAKASKPRTPRPVAAPKPEAVA